MINPNSTEGMTTSLKDEIDTLKLSADIHIHFYTAPKEGATPAPASINNEKDARQSAQACLEDLETNHANYLTDFDGYLIACYSDHPLVSELQQRVEPGVVVMGIFQASMLYAMNYATETCKAAILTSGKDWEPLLDSAVVKFCTSSTEISSFPERKFAHTLAAGVSVLDLHKPDNYPIITKNIDSLIANNVGIVLLGCAGLSTLDHKMKSQYPKIKFVDSVKIGVRLLIAYIQIGNI